MTLFVPRTFSSQEEWTRQSSGVINQLVNRQVAVDTFTTTQTLDYNHDVALCDATSAAFTVTLPKAALHPRRDLIIKKVDASANAVTVEADGAETIDGAANVSLSGQWDFVQVISDGTSWSVIAESASGGGGGTTDDPLTINNSGSGAASGATFDGSAPVTISYNTVGAAASSHTHTQANVTGLTTADSPQFAGVNVGHASDTTITRASAGVIAVEGSNVVTVAGGTFTGDISVPDEAYDATTWNGSVEVPTKNAIRDKIETLGGAWRALGGAYTAAGVWDFAADGAAANIDFTGLTGATDIHLIMEAVTKAVSGAPVVQVSVDNGATWLTTSGDYAFASTAGVRTDAATMGQFHLTNATAARDGIVQILNANKPRPVGLNVTVQTAHRLFLASTSPINAVRIVNSAGGNFTGGKFYCLVR